MKIEEEGILPATIENSRKVADVIVLLANKEANSAPVKIEIAELRKRLWIADQTEDWDRFREILRERERKDKNEDKTDIKSSFTVSILSSETLFVDN